jgi:hypothetical protein
MTWVAAGVSLSKLGQIACTCARAFVDHSSRARMTNARVHPSPLPNGRCSNRCRPHAVVDLGVSITCNARLTHPLPIHVAKGAP